MDWTIILLGIGAGFLAGIINTVSGSGSVITLSLMAFFNIPIDLANGTNRIGILTHAIKSTHSFHKRGQLQLDDSWKIIIFCLTGALAGTFTALSLSSENFNLVLGFIFLGLLLVLIFEPHKSSSNRKKLAKIAPWLMIPVGFYGGFIQVATGIFLLTILQIVSGKSLKELNPLKIFIIMLFNIPAVIIFTIGGKVNWPLGISLAVGQYFGAFLGVKINSSSKNIEPFLRVLLIAMLTAAIAKFWGFF